MKKFRVIFIIFLMVGCKTKVPDEDIFNQAIYKVVEIHLKSSNKEAYATGTIISKDGLILTNKHVLLNTYNGEIFDIIEVRFFDSLTYFEAKIISISENYDLGLIKIDKTTKQYFKLGSEDLIIGSRVYTIGNPNGLGLSFTSGNISSYYKEIEYGKEKIFAIQTDLDINEGNSGGPLFNSKQELIGIMSFRLRDSYNNIINSISFAIPIISINNYLNN